MRSRFPVPIAILILVGLLSLPVVIHYQDRAGRQRASEVGGCIHNMSYLGRVLLRYEEAYGHFPPASVGHNSEGWIDLLRQFRMEKKQLGIDDELKCPVDKADSVTSYQLNPALAGRCLETISESEWSTTPLLFEKKHRGNHGFVFFLDSRVDKIHAKGS